MKPVSSVQREKIRWIWYRYLARKHASLIDSFAGVGKSLTSLDVAARATTGRAMPGEAESLCVPVNVLLFAPEDPEPVIRDRLEAAGADMNRVFIPEGITLRETGKRGRGRAEKKAYLGGKLITFPDEAEQFHRWVKAYGAGLVIIDPIPAFLSPGYKSHVDAEVRQALAPLVAVLDIEDAAAWLIRHFNKDSKQAASMRGGGSVAFGAIARTHMVAGEVPEEAPGEATHAISLVKTNNVRRRKGVALGYSIEDSNLEADDQGTMVPMIRWHGEMPVDAEDLAGRARRGPAPTTQPEWRKLFDDMFGRQETWLVSEIREEAQQRGLAWDRNVYGKVTGPYGIRDFSVPKPGRGGGRKFYWTVSKSRVKEVGERPARREG
jgi:hypothetical protein